MRRRSAYFVGGVNGVGKSALLQALMQRNDNFKLFKGSSRLMEWLHIPGGDYETLRALPDDFKNEQTAEMMRQVLTDKSWDGTLLIDAHYYNYKRGELIDVVQDWIGMVDAMFVVTSDISAVEERLEADQVSGSKTRNLFPEDADSVEKTRLLEHYLAVTTDHAKEIAARYNLPLYILDNSDDLESTVDRFLEIDKQIQNETKLDYK